MRRPALALLVLALAAAGCNWLGDRFKTCEDAFVDLVNSPQSREAVDIVAPGEDPGPLTHLEPGQERRLSFCLSKGDRRGFRAVRDGETLAQATCVASRASYEGIRPEVRWGPAGLQCENW